MILFKITLLLVALVTCIGACVPPLNDFQYLDNATLLQSLVDQTNSNPQTGWANFLNGRGPAKHWPADAFNFVHIHYCYWDQDTKTKLQPAIIRGWELWRSAIGNAGPGYNHRMSGFKEYTVLGQAPFCYINGDQTKWNPVVPKGTLVIGTSSGDHATLGYRPESWDDRPDRHQLRLSVAYMNPVGAAFITAHEMGHVMGLIHEHQRKDRDKYIHFECKNLVGYDAAKALCEQRSVSIEHLCSSGIIGRTEPYASTGLLAYAYSTDEFWEVNHKDRDGNYDGWKHPYDVTADPEWYDVHSIMHYRSMQSWNADKGWTVRGVPLVRWKQGNKDFTPPQEITNENAEVIEEWNPLRPTEKDAAIIKALYHW